MVGLRVPYYELVYITYARGRIAYLISERGEVLIKMLVRLSLPLIFLYCCWIFVRSHGMANSTPDLIGVYMRQLSFYKLNSLPQLSL